VQVQTARTVRCTNHARRLPLASCREASTASSARRLAGHTATRSLCAFPLPPVAPASSFGRVLTAAHSSRLDHSSPPSSRSPSPLPSRRQSSPGASISRQRTFPPSHAVDFLHPPPRPSLTTLALTSRSLCTILRITTTLSTSSILPRSPL
jgi:hypothetical protein